MRDIQGDRGMWSLSLLELLRTDALQRLASPPDNRLSDCLLGSGVDRYHRRIPLAVLAYSRRSRSALQRFNVRN